MTTPARSYLLAFRQSPLFFGAGLLLAWACFYVVLRGGDETESVRRDATLSSNSRPQSSDATASAAPADVLEQEWKTCNVAVLRMSVLEKLLQEKGLRLVYAPAQRFLNLSPADYSGKYVAEVLVGLLRPHGLGFFRQGNSIYVTEMTLKQERKPARADGEMPLQSSLVRTTIRAKVSEPIDMWVDSDPLMRLRIVAQPFYGESQSNLVGLIIEGYRNQEQWFYQDLKTQMGEESLIDVKADGHMWCLVTPTALSGSEITLKMEFYYETMLASV